jgi:hypothetical protein
MDVRIDEAGHEDAVGVTYNFQVCRQSWQQLLCWAYGRYVAVPRDEQSILEKLVAAGIVIRAGIGTEVEDGSPMRARLREISAGRHDRSR